MTDVSMTYPETTSSDTASCEECGRLMGGKTRYYVGGILLCALCYEKHCAKTRR